MYVTTAENQITYNDDGDFYIVDIDVDDIIYEEYKDSYYDLISVAADTTEICECTLVTSIIDHAKDIDMANTVNRKSADLLIELEKGSTFRHKLTWKVGESSNPDPVDLTGATAVMQIRPSISSDTILHELNTSNGGIVLGSVDPVDGTINLYINNTDTTAFNWKKAVYSLEVTLSNTDVRTLIRGNVIAYDEVTR